MGGVNLFIGREGVGGVGLECEFSVQVGVMSFPGALSSHCGVLS